MNKQRPNLWWASALMVFSTSSFTLSGFFAGPSIEGSSFWLALWVRFALPLVLIAPFYRARLGRWVIERNRLQIARALFLVISQGLFFLTALRTSLFQAIVLYNTGPFFILLLDSAYFHKRIGAAALVGVSIGFAGTVAVLGNGLAAANYFALAGVASGVFFALSQFSLYLGSKTSSNQSILFHTYAYGALFALPPLLLWGGSDELGAGHMMSWVSAGSLLLMALCSLGNQWFRGIAYRYTDDVSTLAPWLYFGIVVSLILDYLAKDRLPTALSVFGAVLIIFGALFVGLLRRAARMITRRGHQPGGT